MATLVLGALGTLVGGPLGGAVGALAGRQLDSAIIGGGSREGPRLKDLSLTTSSYGSPIPRHFGRMRVAGSIIWATELTETSESSGGSKGAPRSTTFSYSTSFAVALSSRPILNIGRIWADGNLLRGNAGDLKVGGSLRIYKGHGDQLPDPLLEAAQDGFSPAYRNCAYAVFEDLQLADFGNRIPALTFELIADEGTISVRDVLEPVSSQTESEISFHELSGASDEGDSLASMLGTLGSVYPFSAALDGDLLQLAEEAQTEESSVTLPAALAAPEQGDFGRSDGTSLDRNADKTRPPTAIRYYDTSRDYQPGVQRALGRSAASNGSTLELPAALDANAARQLIASAQARGDWSGERLRWRIAQIDGSLKPGQIVRAPEVVGRWIIESWEWREDGIELELSRLVPRSSAVTSGDSGSHASPTDSLGGPTILRAFELPWDGLGASNQHQIYAAAGSTSAAWKGAMLYSSNTAPLEPIGPTGRAQSSIGELAAPLGSSPALLLEREAQVEVELLTSTEGFATKSVNALAMGQNRLLIDHEIVQFANAEQISATRWLLSGLLRGRGGTEAFAKIGHRAGASVVLLDERIRPLGSVSVTGSLDLAIGAEVAAIGLADEEPVTAPIRNQGVSTKPLTPVHPRSTEQPNGELELCWTRRARGAWNWPDNVEAPLHEEFERYLVAIGSLDAPSLELIVAEPRLALAAAQRTDFSGANVWVRQIGQFSHSDALLITTLAESFQ